MPKIPPHLSRQLQTAFASEGLTLEMPEGGARSDGLFILFRERSFSPQFRRKALQSLIDPDHAGENIVLFRGRNHA